MKRSVFKAAFLIIVFSFVSHIYSDTLHEVQKGETLYSISKTYGVSVTQIQEANGLADNGIKIGQKIKIPQTGTTVTQTAKTSAQTQTSSQVQDKSEQKAALNSDGTYTVQKGETWFGIAKKFGITLSDLQKLNGADENASLKVGQKLKLPSSQSASSTAVAKAAPVKSQGEKTDKKDSAASAKVPDLKKNDPHNYSSKKADASLVWPVKTENIVYINGKIGGVSMIAKKDEEVKAIRAGTVMFSGSYRGFGNVVFIQSKTGHIYAYTGLGSIDVSKGDYISYSSEIGTAGIDTYTGKSQISLMVFQNGQPIDPAKAPRG